MPSFDSRTLDVLDWHTVLGALADRARTPMGAAAVRALGPLSVAAIRHAHDAVAEVRAIEALGGPIPVGAVSDARDAAKRASQGAVLDDPTLRSAGTALTALRELAWRLGEAHDDAPILAEIAQQIDIDGSIANEIRDSYDASGQISAALYPEIGDLRARITSLHDTVRRTLETMVTGDQFADVLQDRFVTMRDDRYVLPIKAHAKNWNLGIVHGSSGSGHTVYVEPTEVVQLNNRLRLAEAELQQAEHRVRATLSGMLGRIREPIVAAIDAAVQIDLACAREALAKALNGTRPIVRTDGVIDLRDARHPILALRGVAVVPNPLRITAERPVLVLTGPNTGGKTVALKTIGLCALLVAVGCWVPASEGSRMDAFDAVLADIGDAQTVHGDLSSFSAHLVTLREMIRAATSAGSRALCLLDEPCSGTDPAQGGALARAILEELRDVGARVVATTHYAQLKGLAEVDARFQLAAMDYVGHKPTYRIIEGAAGESHALDTAARMGISGALVARARTLMSETERALNDALSSLDAARSEAHAAADRAREREQALRVQQAALAAREQTVDGRFRDLERREGSAYVERLRAAEKAIAAVVADLQRSPDPKRAEAARRTVLALGDLAPTAPVGGDVVAELRPGDRVKVRSVGQIGEVVAVGDPVHVRIGSVVVRVKPTDVELAAGGDRAPTPAPTRRAATREKVDLSDAMRTTGNTLDLRGERVEDACDRVDRFLAEAQRSGHDAVFLLHGHGTGALKDALRRWLPSHTGIAAFSPANADQGGDAFTVVAVR